MKASFIIILWCLIGIMSCSKEGSSANAPVIVNKTESVQAFAGENRIKLSWKLPADEGITKCRVYWNNGEDSMTVSVHPGAASDSVFIENLAEGSYSFLVALLDDAGNASAKVSVNESVYGEKYAGSLKNRTVQKFIYNAARSTLDIQWKDAGVGAISTEISYNDLAGVQRTVLLPSYISKSTLEDFSDSKDNIILFRTSFLPELNAIDTFYSAYDTLKFSGDPYVEPKVLWDGDPSKGTGIWKVAKNIDGDGTITVVQDPLYGGVWKFYKPAGSHRTESHAAKGFQAQEGDIIYIGWRYKLDMPQQTTTNAIFQWKAYGADMKQNFPVVLKPVNGNLTLMYHNPDYEAEYLWTTPTVINQWISIVLKLKISRDAGKGYIEFWYNGAQQTFSDGSTRYAARTLDAENCDPKWGIYGADAAEVTNYVTDLKIATTYELSKPE